MISFCFGLGVFNQTESIIQFSRAPSEEFSNKNYENTYKKSNTTMILIKELTKKNKSEASKAAAQRIIDIFNL